MRVVLVGWFPWLGVASVPRRHAAWGLGRVQPGGRPPGGDGAWWPLPSRPPRERPWHPTAAPRLAFLPFQKREIEGNPRKYLGASIWCRPFPDAKFQDAALGFYDKRDRNAATTWTFSPVK